MDKSLQYKILGLGCQMWGEQILTVESMNRMTFPRIAAYAEIGWVSPARKNYMEFLPALMRLVKFNKHNEKGERKNLYFYIKIYIKFIYLINYIFKNIGF